MVTRPGAPAGARPAAAAGGTQTHSNGRAINIDASELSMLNQAGRSQTKVVFGRGEHPKRQELRGRTVHSETCCMYSRCMNKKKASYKCEIMAE
jgi:hypothetical protein